MTNEDEVIDLQLGGHIDDDGNYTAFARIPPPGETEPGTMPALADIRLTFHEDVEGVAVAALIQTFWESVDDIVKAIDTTREAAEAAGAEESEL